MEYSKYYWLNEEKVNLSRYRSEDQNKNKTYSTAEKYLHASFAQKFEEHMSAGFYSLSTFSMDKLW